MAKEKKWYSKKEAVETLNIAESTIKAYADMEVIEKKAYGTSTLYDIEPIKDIKKKALQCALLDTVAIKQLFILREIIREYFPIDLLSEKTYNKFENDILNFCNKYLKKEV